jgi:hypothetical protein
MTTKYPKGLEHLDWQGWSVPHASLSLSEARSIAKQYGVKLPRPQYEVNLGQSDGRTLWLMNQGGNLDWIAGCSPWGTSPFVLKLV